jgi:hypothetical protein
MKENVDSIQGILERAHLWETRGVADLAIETHTCGNPNPMQSFIPPLIRADVEPFKRMCAVAQ